MSLKEKFKNFPVGFFMSFVFIAFVVLLGGRFKYMAPENAIVFADYVTQTYTAPVCLFEGDREFYNEEIVLGEAFDFMMQVDEACFEAGAFYQKGRTILGFLIEKLGFLPETPRRWNEDGTWNW